MLDQLKGAANDVAGKAQDAFGGATGDAGIQLQGKMRQAAGKAQQSFGEAVSSFRESAVSNPLATAAVVAGIGFLLGALWARRD